MTGWIDALFIGGLFTIFKIIRFTGWIQVLVLLGFVLVNIKEYFWYQQGQSFTISDEAKPGIYRGIRRVMTAEGSLLGLLGGMLMLSLGVVMLVDPNITNHITSVLLILGAVFSAPDLVLLIHRRISPNSP